MFARISTSSRWIWTVVFMVWGGIATAVTCTDDTFEGVSLTVCSVDVANEDLRLFHRDLSGEVLGSFSAVASEHGKLGFAMNAGMFHDDRRAVGLYIQDHEETAPLVTREGPGNFGLLPNGVLCLTDGGAQVIESLTYAADPPRCRDATQSGPMLVIDGALHPRFIPGGSSRFIRNGVGVVGNMAHFVISNDVVNFDTFGRYFRDVLQTPNALYFDGKVSRLYAPTLGRSDIGFALGPIVGVLEHK